MSPCPSVNIENEMEIHQKYPALSGKTHGSPSVCSSATETHHHCKREKQHLHGSTMFCSRFMVMLIYDDE